ncbi:MAG: hypothetical protein ACNA8W_01305 [Bradymonadaceae bacterium]
MTFYDRLDGTRQFTGGPLALLTLLAVFLFASPLAANESYNRMLELSEEASQAFRDGRVEDAANLFKEAYAVHPEPVMLKNEMIARFALEDCSRAMQLGRRFLEIDDKATDEDIEDVHGVYAECGLRDAQKALEDGDNPRAMARLEEATPFFFTDDQNKRGQALRDRLKEDATTGDDEPLPPVHDPPPSASSSAPLGIGLTAIGGATLVGTSIWYGIARRQRAELDELAQGGDPERFDELQARLVTANWMIPTLYVVGAATAATGLYFLFLHDDLTGNAMLLPQASPDGFGATLHLRF